MRTRPDRMFGELDGGERSWTPALDVVREDGDLIVRADVLGTKAEDVKIEVEDDILTISGRHEEHTDEQRKHYVPPPKEAKKQTVTITPTAA